MYNTPTDGTEAMPTLEKAEILNTFFSSTFTDERLEDIPINTETILMQILGLLCDYPGNSNN